MVVASACSSPAAAPAGSGESGSASGGLVARTATINLGRVPFDVQSDGRFELLNTSSRTVKLTAAPQVKMLEGC
jgi:hypothetical protein